jgi:hypothetical protein
VLFFRLFGHLLPRGQTWSLTINKALRKFFLGLSEQPQETRNFADKVYLDLFPATARSGNPDVELDPEERSGALEEWEKQYGLVPSDPLNVSARRLALAAEWQATGGQSPDYIQGVLQVAGFGVYVHDSWSSGPPYVFRDPRDYTDQPLVGIYQCTGAPSAPLPSQPQCSALATQPQCNDWLANEIHYLVNQDLTRRAPPPVPSDPDTFPYWFYVGGETFGTSAVVDVTRRAEFERLLLKLRPLHLWIGLLIDYAAISGDTLITEDGDALTTEAGTTLAA